jgi:hypothetical protein
MKTNDIFKSADLKDSKKDEAALQPETTVFDMPEVKDIPGQEHVHVPQFREMQDLTISSADEEGDGILDDLNKETADEDDSDTSVDVTDSEKKLLRKSAGHQPSDETKDFNDMALDDRDNDGDLLNESGIKQDRNGEDLDTPGADLDDDDENVGEEDEENNLYSQSQKD